VEAVAAARPKEGRATGAARIETSSWATRGLIRIEEGDIWTGIDQMKPLAGYALAKAVCWRKFYRAMAVQKRQLTDRFPSIQPRSFRHTSCTSGEVRPQESFDQTVRVG